MEVSRFARATVVLACLVGLVAGTWRWGGEDRAAALGQAPTLSELITGAAAVALPLALLWLCLLVTLVALEPLVGRSLTDLVGCPPALRRLLLTLLGAAVAGAMTVPAHAAPTRSDDDGARPTGTHGATSRVPGLLDGLPLPARPTGAAPQDLAGTPGSRDTARATPISTRTTPTGGPRITVRPGDSLWLLVEQRLPNASDAQVARAVSQLYDANRDRIGGDPDLILPGTTLRSTVDAAHPQEDPS